METVIQLLRVVAVLGAAALLGNWFLAEFKSARARRKPWYTPYLSPPGLIILFLIFFLPLLIRLLR
ncbi:MAG: hypothetical protein LJE63_00015 [Desulfobacteraceae bacterium]|jgi:hypothetical protein|nr:hypothetical protein [Desulfobacteraceae bacterium]